MKAPSTKLLVSAGVVIFAMVAAVAGASNTVTPPGVHNGVITACVEPFTKANQATTGDLKLLRVRKARGRSPGTSGVHEDQLDSPGQKVPRRHQRAPQAPRVRLAPQVRLVQPEPREPRALRVPRVTPGPRELPALVKPAHRSPTASRVLPDPRPENVPTVGVVQVGRLIPSMRPTLS